MNGRRRAAVAAAAVLLAIGAAGCGATTPGPGPYPMPMMTSRPEPPGVGNGNGDSDEDGGRPGPHGPMMSGATTTPSAPHTGALAGEGLDAAAVAELQTAVDHGAQPWRLDRVSVAAAFAHSRLGWMMPSVRDTGTTVLVEGPDAERVTLTLAQPGRTGPTGVWAVTGGSWVP